MTAGLAVRPSRAGDEAALIAILQETFTDTWAPHLPAAAIERFWAEDRAVKFVRAKGQAFMVAEIAGSLAGLIYWEGDFIHSLHVAAQYRGMGVGRALMATAEAAIAAAGFAQVRLETDTFNIRSQALYAALAYREIDRYPDTENDPSITTLLLEKPLR